LRKGTGGRAGREGKKEGRRKGSVGGNLQSPPLGEPPSVVAKGVEKEAELPSNVKGCAQRPERVRREEKELSQIIANKRRSS